MKKNGFTLIEVLAVVVLIGLLTVLVVSKIKPSINDSKDSIAFSSTSSLVARLEEYYFEQKLTGNFFGCTYDFDNSINGCNGFSFAGDKPTGGSVTIDSNGNINGFVYFGKNGYEIKDNKVLNDNINIGGDVSEPEYDITNGLRDRVLTLYASDIAAAANYYIVYRITNPMSADLILYDENFDFKLRVVDDKDNIPFFRLDLINDSMSYTSITNITLDSEGTKEKHEDRWRTFSKGYQFFDNSYDFYIEFFGYPNNISDYQIYKPHFNKIVNYNTNIALDDVLTLPSSYNGEICENYMILTYDSDAQFYCFPSGTSVTYDPSNKSMIFNYNDKHIYRFGYNSDYDIVLKADVDWTGVHNNQYKDNDILDIVVLSTFDITDNNGNVYYSADSTVEKLTTNYVVE